MNFYQSGEEEKRKMLLRKQTFPYEYASSVEKLEATKKIPEKEHFHSILSNSDVADEDYVHAKNVYKTFKMKSLLDFYIFYCEIDTILLCEVLWEFREETFEAFGKFNLNLSPTISFCYTLSFFYRLRFYPFH